MVAIFRVKQVCVGGLGVCGMRVPAQKKGVEDGSEGGEGEEEEEGGWRGV